MHFTLIVFFLGKAVKWFSIVFFMILTSKLSSSQRSLFCSAVESIIGGDCLVVLLDFYDLSALVELFAIEFCMMHPVSIKITPQY